MNGPVYIVMHDYITDEGGGGVEITSYASLEDARKNASKGDVIALLIEEIK